MKMLDRRMGFRRIRYIFLTVAGLLSLWLVQDSLMIQEVVDEKRSLHDGIVQLVPEVPTPSTVEPQEVTLVTMAGITDYSNLDENGYFLGNNLIPNTTVHPNVPLIFYNRVPKCGSRSVMSVIDEMGRKNGYKWISSDIFNQAHLNTVQRAQFVSDFIELKPPYLYDRHIFFINFTEYGFPLPIYMNLIRDPFERLLSFHCYVRDEKPLPMADKRRHQFNTTYEECVNQGYSICVANKVLLNLLAYFCGQDSVCTENPAVSLARAKRNIIKHYSIVGVMEDLEGFFYTLEKKFPGFFKGAQDVFLEHERGLLSKFKNSGKEYPPQYTVDIMRKKLAESYDFYQFVMQRHQNLMNYFKRMDAGLDPALPVKNTVQQKVTQPS